LAGVEHDPHRGDLAAGCPDADHSDGTAGAVQRQPGAAVDGLNGQLGIWLPAQQARGQLGHVLRAVHRG